MAETNNCILAETENDTMWASWYAQYQEAFENILANQQIIYSYLQESFDDTNRAISNLWNSNLKEVEEQKIDEKEQQRLELQAQIEALQNEMNNL